MSTELQYKIVFNADTSGARDAASALASLSAGGRAELEQLGKESGGTGNALDAMASRSGYARQSFVGMEMAARGNTSAIFGVAQSVRALIQSFAVGMGSLSVITLALTAAAKVMEYFTNKYNEAAKASLDAANKTAEFSKALESLMEKQREVSYSLERQIKWLDKIGSYYDYSAGAVDKYADALKKSQAAETATKLAKVDVKEAGGLLRAGNAPGAADAIKLQAERERKIIEREQKKTELLNEKWALQRKQTITGETIRNLGKQRAPAPDIAKAENHLSELKEQRDASRQNHDVYLKLATQIVELEGKLKELKQQEKQRLETLDEQLQVKNSQLLALQQDLDDNAQLQTALDLQGKAEEARLKQQEKINAGNLKELQLKKQEQALAKAIGDQQAANAKALAEARAKEQGLAGKAKAAWGRAETSGPIPKTPEERIAKAKKKAERGIRSPEISALTNPENLKRIAEGENIDEVIRRDKALRWARNRRGRGNERADAYSEAGGLQNAADAAKRAREAMEVDQHAKIVLMEQHLNNIKTTIEKGAFQRT
jgi:hypothetical protein